MTVFLQIIEIFVSCFKAVFQAFLSLLPIYNELSGIKDQIIASAFGVPVIIVSIAGTMLAVAKFAVKKLI